MMKLDSDDTGFLEVPVGTGSLLSSLLAREPEKAHWTWTSILCGVHPARAAALQKMVATSHADLHQHRAPELSKLEEKLGKQTKLLSDASAKIPTGCELLEKARAKAGYEGSWKGLLGDINGSFAEQAASRKSLSRTTMENPKDFLPDVFHLWREQLDATCCVCLDLLIMLGLNLQWHYSLNMI